MRIEDQPNLLDSFDTSPFNPLPCDRWIARSCFQKAIRRGNAKTAVRSLANLFLHDPKAIWRHLAIVALEDIGPGNIEMLRRIVVAKSEYQALRTPGLLWKTFVRLTEMLAASDHCQALCDLLLRVENDPLLSEDHDRIIGAGPSQWAKALYDLSIPVEEAAIAALCFAGLGKRSRSADPLAVFEICSDIAECSEVADLGRSAWKLCRNPMALLLPIVWQRSREWRGRSIGDDGIPIFENINGVPEFALDQFTRVGKAVSRELVRTDLELRSILGAARIAESTWPQVAGDLIFLIEGGLCVRRATWTDAEALRSPQRYLPGTAVLGEAIRPAIAHLASRRCQLTKLRQQLFLPPTAASI